MKNLSQYKNEIHSCSKCGLCQSVCPIYEITKNDCSVSRGMFIMLKRFLKGELKMSKKLNRYLDLCLKCGACTKFCPSGIDIVDIIASAKAEYFNSSWVEKMISFIQSKLIFGLGVNILSLFSKNIQSKKFDKKVIYFGGCGGSLKGNKAVVMLLNSCNIEVITPKFGCCGIPFYVRGDKNTFEIAKANFIKLIEKYDIKEIVTTCASCEKTVKNYKIDGLIVKNIFEYMREHNLKLKLKKKSKATFHKPCNIENYGDIEWILNSTENLEYIKMENFDKCCGLNGIFKLSDYKILSKIPTEKSFCIKQTKAKTVLTSCLGCEVALLLYSFGKYKVLDLTEYLAKNITQ